MIVLGLTGSIGMGKSTSAAMFRQRGVPVFDADEAVHALYRGESSRRIAAEFPGTAGPDGIDRALLAQAVLGDDAALKRLEAIVHPMVRAAEEAFLAAHRAGGDRLVVLDIPLLFENDRTGDVDRVVVVSCPAEEQRRRVLARPGMTAERLAAILARQIPDAEKRARADYVIETGDGLQAAAEAIDRLLADVLERRDA